VAGAAWSRAAGTAGLHRISALASPAAVSARLREIYT